MVWQTKYARQERYKKKNKESIAEKRRLGGVEHDYYYNYQRNYFTNNPIRRKKRVLAIRRYYGRRMDILFNALGNKCSNPNCLVPNGCLDRRCLHLDHIRDDGAHDRKRFYGKFPMVIYYSRHLDEAKQNLQILCSNCNWIKEYERVKAKLKIADQVLIDRYGEDFATFHRKTFPDYYKQ